MDTPLIQVSDAASTKVRELMAQKQLSDMAVRVRVLDLLGRRYSLQFVGIDSLSDADLRIDSNGVTLVTEAVGSERVRGAILDYVESLSGAGFRLDNPNRPALEGLAARVHEVIEDRINPMVAQHGGEVHLLDVREGRVFIEFSGGCQGCGAANQTLKQGIEGTLREILPEVVEVLDTTDHAAGTNPYYQA